VAYGKGELQTGTKSDEEPAKVAPDKSRYPNVDWFAICSK
jgi:hypothetical protein